MKKFLFKVFPLALLGITFANPADAAGLTSLSEGFNSVNTLSSAGWAFQNNSNPAPSVTTPTANWNQGVAGDPINAQAGTAASYIFAGFDSSPGDAGGANGQVSNWLLTPELDFSQGGTFTIYTRTFLGNQANERVDVRLSNAGAGTDVGTSTTSVGTFTTLLQTIGSLSTPFAYPGALSVTNIWQQFTFTIAPGAGSGRIGFNYVGNDAGQNGSSSQFVAFDTATYVAVPEPSAALGLLTLGSFGLTAARRGKSKKAKA
jgi:PEP-CTERM motif